MTPLFFGSIRFVWPSPVTTDGLLTQNECTYETGEGHYGTWPGGAVVPDHDGLELLGDADGDHAGSAPAALLRLGRMASILRWRFLN